MSLHSIRPNLFQTNFFFFPRSRVETYNRSCFMRPQFTHKTISVPYPPFLVLPSLPPLPMSSPHPHRLWNDALHLFIRNKNSSVAPRYVRSCVRTWKSDNIRPPWSINPVVPCYARYQYANTEWPWGVLQLYGFIATRPHLVYTCARTYTVAVDGCVWTLCVRSVFRVEDIIYTGSVDFEM